MNLGKLGVEKRGFELHRLIKPAAWRGGCAASNERTNTNVKQDELGWGKGGQALGTGGAMAEYEIDVEYIFGPFFGWSSICCKPLRYAMSIFVHIWAHHLLFPCPPHPIYPIMKDVIDRCTNFSWDWENCAREGLHAPCVPPDWLWENLSCFVHPTCVCAVHLLRRVRTSSCVEPQTIQWY